MKAIKMIVITMALALSACSQNPFAKPSGDPTSSPAGGGDNSGDEPSEPEKPDEPPPGPSFEMMKALIFNDNTCTGCHSEFGTHDGVVRKLSRIQSFVNQNRMPPGRPLSPELKELLNAWIKLGAPQ